MASQSRSQQPRDKSGENTHHRAAQVPHFTREGPEWFYPGKSRCRNPRSGTAARPHQQLFCSDSPGTCLKVQGPASPCGPLLLPAAFCILENPPVKQLLLLAGEALPLASFWRAALKYRRKIQVSLTNLAKQNLCSHRGTALTCEEHTPSYEQCPGLLAWPSRHAKSWRSPLGHRTAGAACTKATPYKKICVSCPFPLTVLEKIRLRAPIQFSSEQDAEIFLLSSTWALLVELLQERLAIWTLLLGKLLFHHKLLRKPEYI